jgi:hypothetical protein
MKKLVLILTVALIITSLSAVFADDTETTTTSVGDYQGLNMTLRVDGLTEAVINSGLVEATISLYDIDKNLLATESISANKFNYDYGRYNLLFDVPFSEHDKFFVKLDKKSEYLSAIFFGASGYLTEGKFTEFELYSDTNPETFTKTVDGQGTSPINMQASLVQPENVLLVPVTVNGVPTQGVEFVVEAIGDSVVEVQPTDANGILHIPFTTKTNFSIRLKEGQYGYENPREAYFIENSRSGSVTTVALIRDMEMAQGQGETVDGEVEAIPGSSVIVVDFVEKKSGFDNFSDRVDYDENTFDDVSDNDWYSSFVSNAFKMEIIAGKGKGTFAPNAELSIVEAITMAAKTNKLYFGEEPNFSAGATNWYDGIVDYAKTEGIIGTEFEGRYGQKATRAEMAYIFSKSLPAEAFVAINAEFNIPDVDGRTKYNEEIQMMYDAGIFNGSDSIGTFKPTSNVTRAEAATIINKVARPSIRTVRETPVDDNDVVETPVEADVPWEVGTVKVQIGLDQHGNPFYMEREQKAVLIKKGTLVAANTYASEDYYTMNGWSFGCKSMEEYLFVINFMDAVISNMEYTNIKDAPGYNTLLIPYMNGTITDSNLALMENTYSEPQLELLKEGKVDEFLQTLYLSQIRVKISEAKKGYNNTDLTLSQESAIGYIKGAADCNGLSQYSLAYLYMTGFGDSSIIVANSSHAWAVSYYEGILDGRKLVNSKFSLTNIPSVLVVKPSVDITRNAKTITSGDYYNRSFNLAPFQGN